MNKNLTEEELLSKGYKKYEDFLECRSNNLTSYLYQKCIKDKDGNKLYFIDVHPYHYSNGDNYFKGWSFEIQVTPNGYDTINIQTVQWFNETKSFCNEGGNTLEKVEELMDKIYRTLNCSPYECEGIEVD